MGCQFYRVIIIFPPPWLKQGWLIHKKFFFWGGGTLKDDTLIIFRSNHILLIQVQINSSLLMYYIQDLRKVWKSRGGDGTNLGWEGHNLPLWLRWPNQNIDPEPFMLHIDGPWIRMKMSNCKLKCVYLFSIQGRGSKQQFGGPILPAGLTRVIWTPPVANKYVNFKFKLKSR